MYSAIWFLGIVKVLVSKIYGKNETKEQTKQFDAHKNQWFHGRVWDVVAMCHCALAGTCLWRDNGATKVLSHTSQSNG